MSLPKCSCHNFTVVGQIPQSSCMDVTEGCGKPDVVYHGEETVQVICSLLSPCLVGSTALVNCFKFLLVFSILDCCSFFYSPPSSGLNYSLASSPLCIARGFLELPNVHLFLFFCMINNLLHFHLKYLSNKEWLSLEFSHWVAKMPTTTKDKNFLNLGKNKRSGSQTKGEDCKYKVSLAVSGSPTKS